MGGNLGENGWKLYMLLPRASGLPHAGRILAMEQPKFFRGDRVRIAEKLPSFMDHFGGAGKLATVIGSYRDQYGSQFQGEPEYTLEIEGRRALWYPESLLTIYAERDLAILDQLDGVPNPRHPKNA